MIEPGDPYAVPVRPPVWAPPAGPASRGSAVPGTVQAAVIVTWASCAIAALGTIGLTVMAAALGTIVLPYFARADRVEMAVFVAAAALASLAACSVASTCAWFVWRRHHWARVALALCSASILFVSIVFATLLSALTLPAAIAVLVLLFLPSSNSWFRDQRTG